MDDFLLDGQANNDTGVKTKLFKDTVYGYIEIDSQLVDTIINSSVFQRLRNIRQTSYAPLYPNATHNRFVHSLGVYHLGKIASETILRVLKERNKEEPYKLMAAEEWERLIDIFRLACLLHDVGHAPFSHTGESFFNQATYSIFDDLTNLVNTPEFVVPVSSTEHEVMSCIVALNEFACLFESDEEREFFSRCVIGFLYEPVSKGTEEEKKRQNKERQLKNCFVSLLKSQIIDMDRLDYIIRDPISIGYQSINIDYERLLSGIRIGYSEGGEIKVGFTRTSVSVIENVIFAHDNERKWVQSHPSIVYEAYLVKQSLAHIDQLTEHKLFTYDSLSHKGNTIQDTRNNQINVQLLSDADLIYLMKSVYPSKFPKSFLTGTSGDDRRGSLNQTTELSLPIKVIGKESAPY